jgi:hypothetical protein
LLDRSIPDPAAQLALIASGRVVTLLAARSPLTPEDVGRLRAEAEALGFDVLHLPDAPSPVPLLRGIIASTTHAALEVAVRDRVFNFSAPRDDSPYFFNMLRMRGLLSGSTSGAGVVHGNLVATATLGMLLVALSVCTAATVLLPLARLAPATHRGRHFWAAALYFALIGGGFMFLEIALIQRLSLYLGHPVYALGILLFGLIASTGVGSYLSDRIPWTASRLLLPLVMTLAVAMVRIALEAVIARSMASAMPMKIALAIAVIAPMGVLLGQFFPLGMRLATASQLSDTPWFWAVNGVFGVLSSAVAVFVSIYVSLSANFWIAGFCYAGLLLPIAVLASRDRGADVVTGRGDRNDAVA